MQIGESFTAVYQIFNGMVKLLSRRGHSGHREKTGDIMGDERVGRVTPLSSSETEASLFIRLLISVTTVPSVAKPLF